LADLTCNIRLRKSPFIIVGSYRDNEVGPRHPLTIALEVMTLNSVRLYTIEVLPFTGHELKTLLSDIISGNNVAVQYKAELSELLHEKSGGNLCFYLEVTVSWMR